MNERITRLEVVAAEVIRRLDRLEQRLDRLEHLVEGIGGKIAEYRIETRRDIDQAIKWIVGVMLAISMAAITIITFVLNYATPKAAPAAQPVVIYAMPAPARPGTGAP